MSLLERAVRLVGGDETDAPRYECAECGAGFGAPRMGFEEERCPRCGSGDLIGG